ncbi:tetratricopeptide repeat protein [Lentzea flava]|uniref:tetratricopeptide repeat protein n=1 Tax=Lentzea flava TaxID=103732 RepID=UPI00167060E2|nr:tetratricopeptide repeat protein [Lentzea flava]MCP2203396.1 Tetratricopeptide (TPR) repeat [Lentzea flava]
MLVTSRSGLAGLVARNGAHRLTLDLLSCNDSLRLLREVVGAGRVDAEPQSAATLADQCGRLPLALRVAGERAAAEPGLPLRELALDLGDERGRLDLLASDDGDASSAVRAVLSWSYRNLPPAEARLFRLLGLHPGPDFGVPVAAVLADVPLPQAKRLLQSLAGAHLVQASGAGRYRFHDVLRLYAAELVEAEEIRHTAARRMLCWYLHCASAAHHLLLPLFTPHPVVLPEPPDIPAPFTTRGHALAWCETEAANLAAAVRCAAQLGEHALAVQLPGALWGYYDLRKPWTDWIATHEIGLSSARLLGDERKRARITSALGVAYYDLQRFDEAAALFEESLAVSRTVGDDDTGSLDRLGSTYRKQGQFHRALECHRAVLALRLADGNQRSVAVTLNRLGSTYRDLGRFDESLEHLNSSLAIRREIGDLHGQGFALHSIGATYEQLGQLNEAMDAYRQSLAVRREIGDRRGEAELLSCVGNIQLRLGEAGEAREAWTQALTIFRDLGAPQAADVAGKLEALERG